MFQNVHFRRDCYLWAAESVCRKESRPDRRRRTRISQRTRTFLQSLFQWMIKSEQQKRKTRNRTPDANIRKKIIEISY